MLNAQHTMIVTPSCIDHCSPIIYR